MSLESNDGSSVDALFSPSTFSKILLSSPLLAASPDNQALAVQIYNLVPASTPTSPLQARVEALLARGPDDWHADFVAEKCCGTVPLTNLERRATANLLVALHPETLKPIINATSFRPCLWRPMLQAAVAAVMTAAVTGPLQRQASNGLFSGSLYPGGEQSPSFPRMNGDEEAEAEMAAEMPDGRRGYSLAHASQILTVASQICLQRCRQLGSPDDLLIMSSAGANEPFESVLALAQALAFLVHSISFATSSSGGHNRTQEALKAALPWLTSPMASVAADGVNTILLRLAADMATVMQRGQLHVQQTCDILQSAAILLEFEPWLARHRRSERDSNLPPEVVQLILQFTDLAYQVHAQLVAVTAPVEPQLNAPPELEESSLAGASTSAGGLSLLDHSPDAAVASLSGNSAKADDLSAGAKPLQAADDRSVWTTFKAFHRLFLLVRQGLRRSAAANLGELHRGSVRLPLHSVVPGFVLAALSSICQSSSRLLAVPLQRYALCCNPESGKPSSHLREFMEELEAPDGVTMRRQLLQDELVVTGLTQRLEKQGHGGVLADEALEVLWTWLRDVVDFREDVHDRHERDSGASAALHGLAALVHQRRAQRHAGRVSREPMGGPEDADSRQRSFRNLNGTATAAIAGPSVSFLHAPVGQRLHGLSCVFELECWLAWLWSRPEQHNYDRWALSSGGACELTVQEMRLSIKASRAERDQPLSQCLTDLVELAKGMLATSTGAKASTMSQAVLTRVLAVLELIVDLPLTKETRQSLLDSLFLVAARRAEEDIVALRYLIPLICKLFACDYDGVLEIPPERSAAISQLFEHGLSCDMGSVLVAAMRGIRCGRRESNGEAGDLRGFFGAESFLRVTMALDNAFFCPPFFVILNRHLCEVKAKAPLASHMVAITEIIMQSMAHAVQELALDASHMVPSARLPAAARAQVFATGFTLLLTMLEDMDELGFTGRFVSAAVSLLPERHRLSTAAHRVLINGLQRLHLSFTLGVSERDCIVSGVLTSRKKRVYLREPRHVGDITLLFACLYAQDEAVLSSAQQQRGGRPEDPPAAAPALVEEGLVQLLTLLRDPTETSACPTALALALLEFEPPRQMLQALVDRWSSRLTTPTTADERSSSVSSSRGRRAADSDPTARVSPAALAQLASQASSSPGPTRVRPEQRQEQVHAVKHRAALRAEALLACSVFDLLRRRNQSTAIVEWVSMSLGNLLHTQDCERVLACLFAAAAPDEGLARSLVPLLTAGPGQAAASGGEDVDGGLSPTSDSMERALSRSADDMIAMAPELLWLTGLRFFASDMVSSSMRSAMVNMLSSSARPMLRALADACITWRSAQARD